MTTEPQDTESQEVPESSEMMPGSSPAGQSPASEPTTSEQPSGVAPDLAQQAQAAMDAVMSAPEPKPTLDTIGKKSTIRGPRVVQGGREHRSGAVVSVGPEDVFVEFGPKELGVIARSHFTEETVPSVGDTLQVVVQRVDRDQNLSICIPPGAVEKADWEKLEPGQIVEATVVGHNKGGLEMEVAKHRAFLPASKIDVHRVENLEQYVGQKFACKVMTIDRAGKGNIVLSRRDILQKERKQHRATLHESLSVGDTVTGRVTKIMDFGAFVDIGGVDGLIHISDLAYDRVRKVEEVLKEGDEVTAKVLKIEWDDAGKGKKDRIALGMKQAQADPFKSAQDDIKVGEIISGKVTKILEFGCFVEIATGIEGLVHISELDWKRVRSVDAVVSQDQIVSVKVLDIDQEKRRIGLSIKQTTKAPAGGPGAPKEEREESPSLRKLREKAKKQQAAGSGSGGLGAHGSLSGFGLGDIGKLVQDDS